MATTMIGQTMDMIGAKALMPMIEDITSVFSDVQTELIFFGLAIATHLLFFKGLKIGKSNKKAKGPSGPKHKKLPAGASLNAFKQALQKGDLQSAFMHFEAIHSLWQTNDSPSSAPRMLMEQLVKLAAKNQAMQELVELVSKLGLMSKALDFIFIECATHNDAAMMQKAQELARAQGVVFTSGIYQALIKCANMCGTSKDAEKILLEAVKAGVADVMTYNMYIKGLMKNGNMSDVRKVMETMHTAGIRPNSVTFNGILSAAVAVNADSAWSIIDEMKAFDVKPDNVTCSILLKSITPKSKHSVLEKVFEIMNDMAGDVDEMLVSSIVEASVRVGRADLLIPFLKKHSGAGNRLVLKGPHTYGSIIRAYGYVQDVKGAWDAWNEMRKQHIMPISVTLGCMVEALVTNGDIEGGYELVNDMKNDERTAPLVNAVMYGSIVKGFSHKKCFGRVWQVYDEMREQNLKFSMVTYNTLIDACARSSDLGRIPGLLKDIDAQGLKMGLVTYSAILKGYCQTNRIDQAFELLDDIAAAELVPDEIVFNTLLDGCARQGMYDRGMNLLERMVKAGVRPSNFTLSVLVKMCNRSKKLENAFEICDELSKEHRFKLNVHVFNNLIQACIHHRDLPRSIAVLQRMLDERVRPDARSYSLLLRACIDERQAVQAGGLLRAATGIQTLVHKDLAGYGASTMQPQGGVPSELVSEILSALLDLKQERLCCTALFADLSKVSGLKLDPKLKLKFMNRMA